MKSQIKIFSKSIPLQQLKDILEAQPNWNNSGIKIILEERFRSGLDPAIIVAIIGAAGTSMAALINGLIQIYKKRSEKKIVIMDKSGAILEVPANTPMEEIDKLLRKVKEFDVDKIILP